MAKAGMAFSFGCFSDNVDLLYRGSSSVRWGLFSQTCRGLSHWLTPLSAPLLLL